MCGLDSCSIKIIGVGIIVCKHSQGRITDLATPMIQIFFLMAYGGGYILALIIIVHELNLITLF